MHYEILRKECLDILHLKLSYTEWKHELVPPFKLCGQRILWRVNLLVGLKTNILILRLLHVTLFTLFPDGVYPTGEGAGYAGGIVSAAVDGLKVAEAVVKKYENSS